MAMLPARRGGPDLTLIHPSREFEDIYDRMGRFINVAFGDLGLARLTDLPRSPLADVSEAAKPRQIEVKEPESAGDRSG